MKNHSQLGNWLDLAHIHVPGNPNAKSRDEDPTMESWQQVAIMDVGGGGRYHPGFISIFSPIPVVRDRSSESQRFGMRLGPENVIFVVVPHDIMKSLTLELVEITDIDNPTHADVPYF